MAQDEATKGRRSICTDNVAATGGMGDSTADYK